MTLFPSILAPSDEQAMWRVCATGDPDAFAQLLARWEGPIKNLCFRMLGDSHKAEDLTQEAFTRVYTRRADYNHTAKFSTFLWRVAVNLCLDEIRRLKRSREFTPLSEPDSATGRETWENLTGPEPSPDAALESQEQAALVRHAVQRLPEHYRSVVILRHYENLKFREIAEVLGVPEGTVKSRMAEALSMLGQAMKRSQKPAPATAPAPARPAPTQLESLVL